jgi:hypothetical protein
LRLQGTKALIKQDNPEMTDEQIAYGIWGLTN